MTVTIDQTKMTRSTSYMYIHINSKDALFLTIQNFGQLLASHHYVVAEKKVNYANTQLSIKHTFERYKVKNIHTIRLTFTSK